MHQPQASSSSGSGSRPKGSGIEEWSLPLRFRRKPISQEEIDYICVSCLDVVFMGIEVMVSFKVILYEIYCKCQ